MLPEPHTMGERIAWVRQTHGLTWGAVAALLGVHARDVAGYEQGQTVPLPVLAQFCALFGLRWYWLVDGIGERTQCRTLLDWWNLPAGG